MFIKLLVNARELQRKKKNLLKEKEISWKEFQNKKSKARRYRKCCLTLMKRIGKHFMFPKNSYMGKLCFKIRHDGTYENFTVKSVAGFLGGFFLTYIFFMFFVLQLNFKLSTAMIMCSIFGSILTIGLAFSYKVRCIVFLVLPQFFSKKGRQALLAYAYILAITGPAKNTLNNMSILGESLACGQEQLKAAVKQILDVIKKPFYAIRDAIRAVVKAVKEIVLKIKKILLTIKRIIISLLKIIKAGFKFLANIMNMCNKEIGTPYERCRRVFENAIVDCNAKLGPLFNWLCNITYLVKNVCYVVKLLDYLCVVVDFVKDTVSAVVLKVKQFVRHIRVMFYVRIKFSHSYHFESNRSRSMSEITTGIVTEIKQRSSGLIKIFDFMSSAASMFFIFMVVKVIYYRHKFLTNERFDNKFITKDFRQIDLRRAQLAKETVLPLNHRERQQYVTTSSLRLVKKEKSQLSQAAMILLMATLKLSTHMATDYSLYWIMTLIRFYGRFQSKIPSPNVPGLHIEGEGFLANLLKAIVKAFQPIGLNLEIDTIPCLPDPIPPDYDRYIQIASLLVLCWFLAIFEPYGLRFRHSVMCYYHPQRAKERSIWLYNNILRSRSSFLKFARRQLRRKVKGDKSIAKVTFMEFLRAKLNYRVCHWILGEKKQDACLLCGEVFRETDSNKPIKCQTPNCPGLFCEQCFADLQNLCTVCLDPIQYGDISDISEEKDSSEDEKQQEKKKKDKKKKPKLFKGKKKDTDTEGDSDHDDTDKKKLLPRKEKHDTDSDYYSSAGNTSSDVSTDFSYSYQDKKDIAQLPINEPTKTSFTDPEKQPIPEYASMEEFKPSGQPKPKLPDGGIDSSSSNITELNYVLKTADPFIHTSLEHLNLDSPPKSKGSKLSLLNEQNRISDDEEHVSNSRSYSEYSPCSSCHLSEVAAKRTADFLFGDIGQFGRKTNSKISTESIPLEELITNTSRAKSVSLSKLSPQSNTTFISSPKSDMGPKLESTLITFADHSDTAHPDVPKLNLKFIGNSDDGSVCTGSTCSRISCNCRLFKDVVKYDEVSETQRASDTSSSLITEIKLPLSKPTKVVKSIIASDSPSPSANVGYSESPIESGRIMSAGSSSLISSVFRMPKRGNFSFAPATATVSIDKRDIQPISEVKEAASVRSISTGYPQSELRHRSARDTPKSNRYQYVPTDRNFSSPRGFTDSTITQQMYHTSQFSSKETLYSSEYEELRLPGRKFNQTYIPEMDDDRIYRDKIRDYYKYLRTQQFKNYKPPKPKQNIFKKFVKIFKNKKNTDV